MVPTTSTSCCVRPNQETDNTPNTSTTKADGTRGAYALKRNITAIVIAPTAHAHRFASFSEVITCHTKWKKFPCPEEMPVSLWACFTMMVSASPKTKPLRTGLEMNSETAPSLSRPPAKKMMPAAIAAPDANTTYRAESPTAIGATRAASMAADEDVDVTASWRDVPKIA